MTTNRNPCAIPRSPAPCEIAPLPSPWPADRPMPVPVEVGQWRRGPSRDYPVCYVRGVGDLGYRDHVRFHVAYYDAAGYQRNAGLHDPVYVAMEWPDVLPARPEPEVTPAPPEEPMVTTYTVHHVEPRQARLVSSLLAIAMLGMTATPREPR